MEKIIIYYDLFKKMHANYSTQFYLKKNIYVINFYTKL